MSIQLKTIVRLRKDTQANFDNLGKGVWKPANGEVCLVESEDLGIRIKVGNGVDFYEDLKYQDEVTPIIISGYYSAASGNFFKNEYMTDFCIKAKSKLYYATNTGEIFQYDGSAFSKLIGLATESTAGLVKLYNSHGQNLDGTMTQKAITDGIDGVMFDLVADETDSENCLILKKPW